jgi:hypothetical protein
MERSSLKARPLFPAFGGGIIKGPAAELKPPPANDPGVNL